MNGRAELIEAEAGGQDLDEGRPVEAPAAAKAPRRARRPRAAAAPPEPPPPAAPPIEEIEEVGVRVAGPPEEPPADASLWGAQPGDTLYEVEVEVRNQASQQAGQPAAMGEMAAG